MSITIEAKNENVAVLENPNGFWSAFCVETPVSNLIGCEYTERGTIRYEHEGFVGMWFSEDEALEMYKMLKIYVKTDSYLNHRYFATRKNQMNSMLEFLPLCGGFRQAS